MIACELPWAFMMSVIGALAIIGGGTIGCTLGYERARKAKTTGAA